ncbi:MAG: class I SAM-dependent methyltransferase [Planctomycetaceae bacterium]
MRPLSTPDETEIQPPCPLCSSDDAVPFHRDSKREYLQCGICRLVFVPPQFFLSEADEKAHYDHHRNSPDDPQYREFLSRLLRPMRDVLPPNSEGLDFGCGPGPALSVMFGELGHRVTNYDKFYNDDRSALSRTCDFITASEVAEHLHSPGREFQRLWSCLRPGGVLGVMTQPLPQPSQFPDWYYKADPTHVCFYSATTWRWIADFLDAKLIRPRVDVTLLVKRQS